MVFVNSFFETRVEQLFDLANRIESAFSAAGLDYRVVGGLAAYLYMEEADPAAGRLTRDIDIAVRPEDLSRIAEAVKPIGLDYRHVSGVDMLVQAEAPAGKAVHMTPVPELGLFRTVQQLRLIPLADLVRMKLTSFHLKDQTHLKDLEEAGLITPEVEAGLSETLRRRLADVRSHE